jgi:transketolase
MIACRTIIGFGFPTKAGTQKAHSDAPGEDEIAGAREILGWGYPPFVIPEGLLGEWRAIGAKGGKARAEWADRVGRAPDGLRREFERRNAGELPATGGEPSPPPAASSSRPARRWRRARRAAP